MILRNETFMLPAQSQWCSGRVLSSFIYLLVCLSSWKSSTPYRPTLGLSGLPSNRFLHVADCGLCLLGHWRAELVYKSSGVRSPLATVTQSAITDELVEDDHCLQSHVPVRGPHPLLSPVTLETVSLFIISLVATGRFTRPPPPPPPLCLSGRFSGTWTSSDAA